jgi:hypothetical protein
MFPGGVEGTPKRTNGWRILMGVENVAVAAATAALDYDIFSLNEDLRRRSYRRVIIGISVCGSGAAGDTEFELKVNGQKFGRYRNIATGWPTRDHRKNVAIPIPPNALVEAEITDAAVTNAINVEVETVP